KEIDKAKLEIETMYRVIQKTNYEWSKKSQDLLFLKSELEKLKGEMDKIKLLIEKPKTTTEFESNRIIEELKSKLLTPDKNLLELLERIKVLEERISLLELSFKESPAVIE
ncbi:MAG: hypothetical protein NZ893_02195, partial [Candidatus Aenigmarchaeota archaeon]|nr:hypothetical protein [Candidatus Aenigmarchaeota archaeon]